MKLHEIIEPLLKNIQAPNLNFEPGPFNRKSFRRNMKHARPHGEFSHISNQNNDPFTIKKTSNASRPEMGHLRKVDGFDHYADVIIKNKLNQWNPYFPRIYIKKNISDTKGNTIASYEMEKLISSDTIESELLNSYARNLLPDELVKSTEGFWPNGFDNYYGLLLNKIDDSVMGNRMKFKDELLTQTCKIIHDNQDVYRIDLHSGNYMFRRISRGIQLVVVDPYGAPQGFDWDEYDTRNKL